MILKLNTWKKLITEAYKGAGLHIAMVDKGILLMRKDYEWIINVDSTHMPKEYKAELIRIIGEMPRIGECLLYRKGDPAQFEMEEASVGVMNLWGMLAGFKYEYERTPLLFGDRHHDRLMRCVNSDTKHIVAVDEEVYRGIERHGEVQEGELAKETDCRGPYGSTDYGPSKLCWYNNVMLFAVIAYCPDTGTNEGLLFKELEKPHMVLTDSEAMADKRKKEMRKEAEAEDEDEEN